MHYELAKQLKDAGFSLKHNECNSVECRCDVKILDGGWIIPTLEELIGACHADFGGLMRWPAGNKKGDWESQSTDGTLSEWRSVPNEAAARLWLLLNDPQSVVSRHWGGSFPLDDRDLWSGDRGRNLGNLTPARPTCRRLAQTGYCNP
jgi:hypothetical protein